MLLKIYGLDKYYDTIKQTLLHLYKTRFAVKEKNVKGIKKRGCTSLLDTLVFYTLLSNNALYIIGRTYMIKVFELLSKIFSIAIAQYTCNIRNTILLGSQQFKCFVHLNELIYSSGGFPVISFILL